MPARRIILHGQVQGQGVRPVIARLAARLNLRGSVRNSPRGVEVELWGSPVDLDRFRESLLPSLPCLASVDAIEEADSDLDSQPPPSEFQILPSERSGLAATHVPPDVAICVSCLAELKEPTNRRYEYPLITCTVCGPRYSLIAAMPYDRWATSMVSFQQCASCHSEYTRPADARFHSQTNACQRCGPRVRLTDTDGQEIAADAAAIAAAARAITEGKIIGLLAVGGYQWIADATQPNAIEELRKRKGRPTKPLAILVTDIEVAAELADLSPTDRLALIDPTNPIVLLNRVRHPPPVTVADSVAGNVASIGILLPTTGLHRLLLDKLNGRPLVATSGNLDGEPLAYRRLSIASETPPHSVNRSKPGLPESATPSMANPVADLWLDHDRPILRPIDDSVVRVIAGQTATIRLARGLAPLPLAFPSTWQRAGQNRPVVALGGHQKAAIALFNGHQAVLGPHLGDLDNESTRIRYLQSLVSLCDLYRVRPDCWAHDAHPDYFTTRVATDLATGAFRQSETRSLLFLARSHATCLPVQHHHAHIAARMIEAGWLERRVLGVVWDGTGYGDDQTIWGGEFLIVSGRSYQRFACLRPFWLVGGELAIREPWRVAVSLVFDAIGPEAARDTTFPTIDPLMVSRVVDRLERGERTSAEPPPGGMLAASSAGRLLDGLAALTLGQSHADFDAELVMRFESLADNLPNDPYPIDLHNTHSIVQLDWRPMVRGVLRDQVQNLPASVISARVHRTLAVGIAKVVELQPDLPIALCGGCFQNKLLTETFIREPRCQSREVATPGRIPVGDGGLAAGQLAIALAPPQRPQTSTS